MLSDLNYYEMLLLVQMYFFIGDWNRRNRNSFPDAIKFRQMESDSFTLNEEGRLAGWIPIETFSNIKSKNDLFMMFHITNFNKRHWLQSLYLNITLILRTFLAFKDNLKFKFGYNSIQKCRLNGIHSLHISEDESNLLFIKPIKKIKS